MECTVDGEDISPEEYNNEKLWTLAIKAHDLVHPKKKTATPLTSSITIDDGNGKAAEKEKSAAGRPTIRRRRPLPRLPATDYKVVFRPKGGLDLRSHIATTLLQTGCQGSDTDIATARKQDQVRVNPTNNSFTVSSPSAERVKKYVSLQKLRIMDQIYPVNAYIPAPDEAIKGIAYNVLDDQTREEILEDIQDLNKGCQIAEARRLGKTSSLLITFTGTHKVPSQIRLFGGLYPCYPFRAKTEACFNCRRAGHRADVCPREKTNLCNRCGTQHPAKETPDCTPKCTLCNGDHFTGTRSCKARFERPNYRGRTPTESQWQRGQQQDSGGHRSRSRGRSNASQRYRRSRSRSTSFPPLPKADNQESPKQVSWKPQTSRERDGNAELRAIIQRQNETIKELKEMIVNLQGRNAPEKEAQSSKQHTPSMKSNSSVPPSAASSRASSPQRSPPAKKRPIETVKDAESPTLDFIMKEQIGALATQLNGRMDALEARLSQTEATVATIQTQLTDHAEQLVAISLSKSGLINAQVQRANQYGGKS
ncbi:hypothetical protein HPB49_006588 [Dermacentor silvarum]|uniref:Uncharacterized protein n=1 Tax=Dermacentor silvarum TaxID=543639 RepID=A0ACB8CDS3_DERSI|nr:hypothetical protein HPB49_006588 [Dermacentor silvarum]